MRHELRRRTLTVLRTAEVAPGMVRITFGGGDLEGFAAPGPADHVKAFFPAGDGSTDSGSTDSRSTDSGSTVARDYTPRAFRSDAESGPELDLDFVLHGHAGAFGGPAAAWAAAAQPGDTIEIGGPRGSALPPRGIESAILVADESALPAAARWLEALDASGAPVPTTVLIGVEDAATAAYLAGYEREGRELRCFAGAGRDARIAEALRGAEIGEGTFLFLAGESTALIPLRRYLRRELGLPKEQVDVSGYWKRGTAGHDHHAPVDPDDAD